LSGITRDVIPFGFAFGPKAELVGLNMVGSGAAVMGAPDIHRLRQCYRTLFLGAGEFRDRLAAVAAEHAADPLVGKIIDFLRAGGSRPPMMPPRDRGGERAEASAMNE